VEVLKLIFEFLQTIMRQPITNKATFRFEDVGPGEYVLNVLSRRQIFQVSSEPLLTLYTIRLTLPDSHGPTPSTSRRSRRR
jgi:hypothetical protein